MITVSSLLFGFTTLNILKNALVAAFKLEIFPGPTPDSFAGLTASALGYSINLAIYSAIFALVG